MSRVLPTVWNGMPAGPLAAHDARGQRRRLACRPRGSRAPAPGRRRRAAWPVWNAKIGRRARVGGLLQRRERRRRQVAGNLADDVRAGEPPARGRRRPPPRWCSPARLRARGPPCGTAASSRSRLNTEFTSAGTNSVPTLFTAGTTRRISREHLVVRRQQVDAGDVRAGDRCRLPAPAAIGLDDVREDDGHAAAPAASPPAASASRT